MSLDTVVDDIRSEAFERAEEIREAAREEATEIRAEAEDRAAEIRAEAEEYAERKAEQEREQALSSAKLAAKQERLSARQEVLDETREATAEAIAAIEGERRESLTRALLEDAAAEFDDDAALEVYGRASDADLLAECCEASDRFEHAGEVDCLGGVVVESQSSRVRVDNTFDAVLDEVWEDQLKEISDRLFEE